MGDNGVNFVGKGAHRLRRPLHGRPHHITDEIVALVNNERLGILAGGQENALLGGPGRGCQAARAILVTLYGGQGHGR